MAPRQGLRDPKGGVAKINVEMHYLWRAVDHEGELLEFLASKTRDMLANLEFVKKLIRQFVSAKAITTDGLR